MKIATLWMAAVLMSTGCEKASSETAAPRAESVSTSPEPRAVTADGYEVVFADPSSKRGGPAPSRPGETAQARNEERLIREPNAPDPEAGAFTLEEAVAGMPIDGALVVEIATDLGTMFCDLDAEHAPRTVANFIGLARGLRPWWDARAGQWVKRPYYAGLTIHRVMPDFGVQGGDYLGDGTGRIGYTIPDENKSVLHDRAGLLCVANPDGADSGGGQFFVTDGAAPHLDGAYTVFGRCREADLVHRIARVPQTGAPDNRPLTPVRINRFLVRRVVGGAASARPTQPQVPPDLEGEWRGATPPGGGKQP